MPAKSKDEKQLAKLIARRATYNEIMDEAIQKLRARIANRWRLMPVDTLGQAKNAEYVRLRDIGCTVEQARRSIANDLRCILSTNDPDMRPSSTPVVLTWYNAATDTEWSYRDCGDRYEIDVRWAIAITSASRFNPIRRYQRNRILQEGK